MIKLLKRREIDDQNKKIIKTVNQELEEIIDDLNDMFENFIITKQEYDYRVKVRTEELKGKTQMIQMNKLDHPQELKTDIRRLVRDTQKILLGVCQGGFVRRVKFT